MLYSCRAESSCRWLQVYSWLSLIQHHELCFGFHLWSSQRAFSSDNDSLCSLAPSTSPLSPKYLHRTYHQKQATRSPKFQWAIKHSLLQHLFISLAHRCALHGPPFLFPSLPQSRCTSQRVLCASPLFSLQLCFEFAGPFTTLSRLTAPHLRLSSYPSSTPVLFLHVFTSHKVTWLKKKKSKYPHFSFLYIFPHSSQD